MRQAIANAHSPSHFLFLILTQTDKKNNRQNAFFIIFFTQNIVLCNKCKNDASKIAIFHVYYLYDCNLLISLV